MRNVIIRSKYSIDQCKIVKNPSSLEWNSGKEPKGLDLKREGIKNRIVKRVIKINNSLIWDKSKIEFILNLFLINTPIRMMNKNNIIQISPIVRDLVNNFDIL